MTTAEALRTLNVRAQTLYANVSRGKIRAKPDTADPRRSLYHRGDVLRMAERSNGRRKVETVAARAIEWGDPVLPSAVSTVVDGRLWYRGRDAVELAASKSFEEVAGILWNSDSIVIETTATRAKSAVEGPLKASLVALAERSASDVPSHGRAQAVLREEAGSVRHPRTRDARRASAARRTCIERAPGGRVETP